MKQELSTRKRFGLLISHLASDYALKRCLGVERAAEEANVDIVIFPGTLMQDFLGSNKQASFTFTHNIIFEYAVKFHLDALLICIAGIADYYDRQDFQAFLEHFSGIPVILLETRIPGYRSLVTDNQDGICALLEHLIEAHHYRKICYVSGPHNNYDAQVRKQAYLDTMQSHGLSVTPKMVVNGWFSFRCEEAIDRLLEDNPGLEAICCANDLMAACACQVLMRHGLAPGRDIAVTGFDDADLAKALDPPLTTYRVNSYELGYQAVYEALHLLRNEPQQVDRVCGDLILRSSCGCSYRAGWGAFLDRFLPLTSDKIEAITQQVLLHSLRYPVADPRSVHSYPLLLLILSSLLEASAPDFEGRFDSDGLADCVRKLLSLCSSELSTESLQNVMDVFLEKLCLQVADPERKNLLLNFRINLRQVLFDYMLREHQTTASLELEHIWLATDLMQNALFRSSRSPEALREICYRLQEMGAQSAYLYTYPEAIPVKKDGKWRCAERMRLAAYLKRGSVIVPEKGILMENQDLLQRLSAVQGRRYTMMAFCLITEEEQHGFFLCESDLSRYFTTYVTSMQISAVLKFFSLLEQRTNMEAELKTALDIISRKNEMLQLLSTKDDLTRSLNRRGFLEQMQSYILRNQGRTSALCLLDLDNLKCINDHFGHREGDFALSRFAKLVQGVAEPEDVFGRYGGDEFILLVPEIGETRMSTLPEQLVKSFESFNKTSHKPYYIEASFGLLPFVCAKDTSMENLLAEVDKLLYRDKKKKRRSAVKEPDAAG